MLKYTTFLFASIFFYISFLFGQENTKSTISHSSQDSVGAMDVIISREPPIEDSVRIPNHMITHLWNHMVMNYEPEEKADTSSYTVFRYTNDQRNDQFLILHSKTTERDYFFYLSLLHGSFHVFRFSLEVRPTSWRSRYDQKSLNDSTLKYLPGFNE